MAHERPKTQREMIEQLWLKVVGNGSPGLAERFEKHEQDEKENQKTMIDTLNGLSATVARLAGKMEGHMGTSRPSRKEINKQKLLEVGLVAGILGICVTAGVLIAAKVIVPDDIWEGIRAWRGSAP